MKPARPTIGRQFLGGLILWSSTLLFAAGMVSVSAMAQGSNSSDSHVALSAQEIAALKEKAEAGDTVAEVRLGQAYREGDGVPRSEELAYTWTRKAAEQGNAVAENAVGTMYRMGKGVNRDKEQALRWYQKAAHHGSPEGMFNLGTCYYNGEGVGSNEYTAYLWFLVAQDLGDMVAYEAAKRSAATMSKRETSDAYVQIGEMYYRGESLPKDEVQHVRWLRRAAELDSLGKVHFAVYLLTGPDSSRDYAKALELCKDAARDYGPAFPCVGFIYRKGLGVPRDAAEAAKWYEKGVKNGNSMSVMVLAEMYAAGEGTKTDRPEAFVLLIRCWGMGLKGAKEKASEILRQMSKAEQKEVEKKLIQMRLDPKKVFEQMRSGSPPGQP